MGGQGVAACLFIRLALLNYSAMAAPYVPIIHGKPFLAQALGTRIGAYFGPLNLGIR